jgi:nitroimidazol reductase NimA-like FMN-containing flavoprotein (pyridoxamine 5'-phosphate oxidase superfamily)
MTREMRRHERVLDESKTRELLLNGEYGVLSTSSVDGGVYGFPMNYVASYEYIYFHCAMVGHKIDNIKANPLVSFCVVGKTEVSPAAFTTAYESIVVSGLIETVDVEDEKRDALRLLVKKYSQGFEAEGNVYIDKAINKTKILKLTIDSITGKGRQL